MKTTFLKVVSSIVLSLYYLSGFSQATVTYTEDFSDFRNPERGFYYQSSSFIDQGDAFNSPYKFKPIEAYVPTDECEPKKISLVQRIIRLDAFIPTPTNPNPVIPPAFITFIENDFNFLRTNGLKCILRFSYSKYSQTDITNANGMLTFEPPISVIINHITQLSQVVQNNQDVISSLEAGFIGNYGEWYYSHPTLSSFGVGSPSNIDSNITFKNNRIQVANAIMAMAPTRIVAFRTPYFQKLLAPSPVIPYYTNNVYSKVACHNDAFLHDITDDGTYRENPNTLADRNYLNLQSKYNFTGGESNALNSNFATCVNASLNSPLNKTAIQQMQDYHFSYLNHSYFEDLMDPVDGFFAMEVSPPTIPAGGNWLQEIKRRMGYRFVLNSSSVSSNTLTINIQNKGFANVFNQRKIYLVLKNGSTLYKVNISGPHDSKTTLPAGYSTEVRVWMAGSSFMLSRNLLGMVTTASTPGVPVGTTVPPGTYSLYLELPDQILANLPKYSIRFANTGVWDGTTGLNSLNRSVTITATTASRMAQNDVSFFDVNNYPNPFTENFKLDINTSIQEPTTIKVYDIVGKLIESSIVNYNNLNNVYLGSALSSGMYHVLVTQGDNNKTIRVVKE